MVFMKDGAMKNRSRNGRAVTGSFATDEQRWAALQRRDRSADGKFLYSVRTTGVYCRPSCGARLARRENVEFYASAEQAERAGFRACKRCRPNAGGLDEQYAGAVERACRLIESADEAPKLECMARAAGMSPFHFHRVFRKMTGLTPKRYAAAHRAERIRKELARSGTVTEAIYRAGYNSNSRFYEKSSAILGMKPGNFQKGGKGEKIHFAIGSSTLGLVLVASSRKGVCAILLGSDRAELVVELRERFGHAELMSGGREFSELVARVIEYVEKPGLRWTLPLDVRGTVFQQKVWEALGEIPAGKTASYSEIARRLGQPNSVRAVARACASNAIAVAIPCHRAVAKDGTLAGYRWGVERKRALLEREGV
jgi:AraC family transcriptional regulator of adaptative response/methylated-DNA-[protein]-cysteine methyltransferase